MRDLCNNENQTWFVATTPTITRLLIGAVREVVDLHRKVYDLEVPHCYACDEPYPCPTITHYTGGPEMDNKMSFRQVVDELVRDIYNMSDILRELEYFYGADLSKVPVRWTIKDAETLRRALDNFSVLPLTPGAETYYQVVRRISEEGYLPARVCRVLNAVRSRNNSIGLRGWTPEDLLPVRDLLNKETL